MRRTRNLIALLMAAVMCLCLFAGCGSSRQRKRQRSRDHYEGNKPCRPRRLQDSRPAGTFHADALTQIKNVQSSTYPEFATSDRSQVRRLSTAMSRKSPTASSVCQSMRT